ncbi:hypothetical protein [Micromonospora tarensis]|uniref:Uncharacterized protein n=1 Tax=Micromonospora tarensis TaxID=2806100 RepID=A0ABS1YGA0_9ACTN|nr:hypothetical protein [Micromonospora tarensis]MBM0276241.1 hypothetical protein [Micromonospora tarensis]
MPLIDDTKAMADERERMQGSLSGLFGISTLSTDARKVAARTGLGVEQPPHEGSIQRCARACALEPGAAHVQAGQRCAQVSTGNARYRGDEHPEIVP